MLVSVGGIGCVPDQSRQRSGAVRLGGKDRQRKGKYVRAVQGKRAARGHSVGLLNAGMPPQLAVYTSADECAPYKMDKTGRGRHGTACLGGVEPGPGARELKSHPPAPNLGHQTQLGALRVRHAALRHLGRLEHAGSAACFRSHPRSAE